MSRVAWARLAVILGGVALVEALCRFGAINRLTLLPPSEMAADLVQILASGAVNEAMARTFTTIAVAFALSVSVGLVLGLAIHAVPRVRRALDPLLASYYSVPFFVFYPLLIALFGLTIFPLVVIGFAFGVAAMVISTLNGLDRVPRVLLKVARVHRLSRAEAVRRIIVPAAAPYIFTGLKLALAYSFIGVLAGEFILSNGGIGHAIAYAYDNFDNRTMYALMLFVLILAISLNAALHVWEQRLMRRRSRG